MDVARRRLLSLGGMAGAVAFATGHEPIVAPRRPPHSPGADPFTLGVASGDPLPGSVVLWTRLAPDPLVPSGGMGPGAVEVEWELAENAAMRRGTRRGVTSCFFDQAHSVHVVVDGLGAGRDYWYRFRVGRWLSPIGRTKTAPSPGRTLQGLDLAAASCQSWAEGHYAAHRHLAEEGVDAVVFLGDSLYEGPITGDGGRNLDLPQSLRPEVKTLAGYRVRHALYRLDPHLQASHAAAPWIVTWDDHEVADDYAGASSGVGGPPARDNFAARRAAAYQAFWEHLPLRTGPPRRGAMRMHRRLRFGSLLDVHVLDTRQHRDSQVGGAAWQPDSPARRDPTRGMLGRHQEGWLAEGLRSGPAAWNLVAQQVVMGRLDLDPTSREQYRNDAWDGYAAAQGRVHDALAKATNPVVLTGDVHAAYTLDLHQRPGDTDSPRVGVELAATSISSGGDGAEITPSGRAVLDANDHVHYVNQRRGYLRCRITRGELTAAFRTLPYVEASPDAPIATDRTFVVAAGESRLHAT